MPMDRFLIAAYSQGLRTDLRPWIIPDEAFEKLQNAYVFRGRVTKRFGSIYMGTGIESTPETEQFYSRLRISVGMTDLNGDLAGIVPGATGAVGQAFSIGDQMFTVVNGAAGAQDMLNTGVVTTDTFDVTTGAFVFVGADPNTIVYFYPALPVMGLGLYEIGPINNQPLFGFDTRFAYEFNSSTGWDRSDTAGAPIFQGTDTDFFWTANWRGITADVSVLFVTNFNSAAGVPPLTQDRIWSYNGTAWAQFIPYFLPTGFAPMMGPSVVTARIIIPFKNRLLLLNTIETNAPANTNTSYVNRCRYSAVSSPFAVNAWYELNQVDTAGNVAIGGGFIDAATQESIVSAEFIKDRLIVYFDRSTWEIVYTGNQVEPFVWQKINTELGSQSTFSTVPFDKVVLTIGNTGVHACNGANVERIDSNIPQQIFEIQDSPGGAKRIGGIRDYFSEMVYWTFSSDTDQFTYPNQVLVYNYKNGAWALNDDSITVFGYFEQQTDTSATWEEITTTWQETDYTWNSGIVQAEFRQVVAGNQEGYTFILDTEVNRNAGVLQITNFSLAPNGTIQLTIINHNLSQGESIFLENVQGFSDFENIIVQVTEIIDANTIYTDAAYNYTGTYSGAGTVAKVSNVQLLTKQFNPYIQQGNNVFVQKIDFGVASTQHGEITVDYFPSATSLSMITNGEATNSIMGNNILETRPYDPLFYPLEAFQQRLWHTIYFQSYGECIQLFLHMTPAQLENQNIAFSDFELEGMILYTQPTGRLG